MPDRKLELEAVRCGVCHSDESQVYATGRDFEYHTSDDEFTMVRCENCGNVYLNPRPSMSELTTIYPRHYYAYNYDKSINPLAIKAKDILDGRKVSRWLSYLSPEDPMFLDVGCGNGRYLKLLHKLGIPKNKLYGVELDQEGISSLNHEGFSGFNGRIEDVANQLPQESFDLIIILQVLEHVEDPDKVIACLAKLLKVGGTIVIETPSVESLDAAIFCKRYWGGYHFPRHWNLFNTSVLRFLVDQHNLDVQEFNYLPAHSFWIFSFHHLIEERWKARWLADLFDPLQNLWLLGLFTVFDLVRAGLGFHTSNLQCIAVKRVEAG